MLALHKDFFDLHWNVFKSKATKIYILLTMAYKIMQGNLNNLYLLKFTSYASCFLIFKILLH